MAWTAPRTWVTSEVVTASNMNTHVRDNFLETAPGKASGSGGIFVSTGTNAIAMRATSKDEVAGTTTITSTSYTGTAPATTATTGTKALVLVGAAVKTDTANSRCFMSVAVSGATTISAVDGASYNVTPATAEEFHEAAHFVYFDALTAGSNTFTAQYRVDAGEGVWARRRIFLMPF